jgi:putative Holliday junction resolvase
MVADPAARSVSGCGVPGAGRLLGIDCGEKRVGFALSTDEQTLATPLETYARRDARLDALRLTQIVRENRVVGLVVGLPLHFHGEEGRKAREARTFAAWCSEVVQLPVELHDERCTSSVAEDYLDELRVPAHKRKALRDQIAAQIMLQAFLDRRRESRREKTDAEITGT